MKNKVLCLIGLLLIAVCFVGIASAETLTVVYCTEQSAYPFNVNASGNIGITVKDGSNNYWRYFPTLESTDPDNAKVSLSGTPEQYGWNTVYYLGSDGFIQSDGNQLINTGVVSKTTDIWEFTAQWINSGGQYRLFGYEASYSNKRRFGIEASGSSISYFIDTSVSISADYNKHNYYIDWNGGLLKVDSQQASFSQSTTVDITYTTYLFQENSVFTQKWASAMKLYNFKYYQDGVLLRDYIPIRIGDSGEYALYDNCLSGNVIYKNGGILSFTGGGTRTPLTYTHSVGPSISAISITSGTSAEIGSTVTVTATLENTPATDTGLVTFYTSATPTVSASWVSVGSKAISTQVTGIVTHSFTGSSTPGTYYIKAILSDTTQSVTYDSYTDGSINVYVTLLNYHPIINSVNLTSPTPAATDTSVTATVSAVNYQGTTTGLIYKWFYSLNSISWTEITGQTSTSLSTTFRTEGTYLIKAVVTDTSVSLSTDSYSVGKYASVQIVPVPSISAVAVNPYILDLSVSNSVQLSASIVNPAGVSSMVWQQNKDNGGWVNTTLTQATGSVTVSTTGTYLYRLIVIPYLGSQITSDITHDVKAGSYPVIKITAPAAGSSFDTGEIINITATGSGYTSFTWDFGSGVQASGNTHTLTPWVQYSTAGGHTITLTAVNSFGSKTVSVTVSVISGSSKRPLAVSTPAPIPDSQAIMEWTKNLEPQSEEDQSPDIWGMFEGFTKPFTSVMGQWFYLALFAIPYLLIWIRTRNTMIPSIIGILFGSWLLVMLPSTAMAAAICILVLSVSGGIFGIFLTRRQRE